VEWHGDGRVAEDLTDLAGHYLGSVDPSTGAWTGERIPGSSIYLAWYVNGGTTFFHYNALGSSMMNTHQDGNTVSNDVLFYPWGQMWASPVNDYFQFFGNIEGWDWEIGEGVTPNRYYPNYQGRWLSPDPLAGDVSNPQSLNRYAYVLNNPTSLTDPLGLNPYEDPGGIECRDPTFAESHAQCQGPGSPWCTAFPDDLGCIDFGAGGGGGGGGGQAGGGVTPPTSGRPVGGGLPPSMGNAAFGGLITCTRVSVKIGGVSYPAGPLQCSLSMPLWLRGLLTVPWAVNWIIPVYPVPVLSGVGPAGGFAFNPATHTLCASAGIGASASHNFALGPITDAHMWNGTSPFPSGIMQRIFSSAGAADNTLVDDLKVVRAR
jgi:RHS repeat-associated protein